MDAPSVICEELPGVHLIRRAFQKNCGLELWRCLFPIRGFGPDAIILLIQPALAV